MKGFLKLLKLLTVLKQGAYHLSSNFALATFANSVLNKGKYGITLQFNGSKILPSASNKANFSAEIFSENENSNLND